MVSWVEAVSKIRLSASSERAFFEWDVSFGIPMNELKKILNAAGLAEEFADDDPKWDETQPCIERMPSTSKQAASILNIEAFYTHQC
ncbi:hypothetical protein TNCT_679261 [Trichonephila clavata]|uniref:Uncharacterized protein n=1 Tax=Trichonephila clavata TaxID=2740835 RepID=A0A8X6IVZ7_TRICU|nr:hypothetical protein TNCT_679261 [Trichonephila clavata]